MEIIDSILEVEDAIAELEAMSGDEPDQRIKQEIRRLDERLRFFAEDQNVFVQLA
ncbi:MAG TPA: hypothetical protein VFG20_14500 [Planctomycetaceae bacterium]|nr:hypothetical protein [Planctomycetaceae bacterium]